MAPVSSDEELKLVYAFIKSSEKPKMPEVAKLMDIKLTTCHGRWNALIKKLAAQFPEFDDADTATTAPVTPAKKVTTTPNGSSKRKRATKKDKSATPATEDEPVEKKAKTEVKENDSGDEAGVNGKGDEDTAADEA